MPSKEELKYSLHIFAREAETAGVDLMLPAIRTNINETLDEEFFNEVAILLVPYAVHLMKLIGLEGNRESPYFEHLEELKIKLQQLNKLGVDDSFWEIQKDWQYFFKNIKVDLLQEDSLILDGKNFEFFFYKHFINQHFSSKLSYAMRFMQCLFYEKLKVNSLGRVKTLREVLDKKNHRQAVRISVSTDAESDVFLALICLELDREQMHYLLKQILKVGQVNYFAMKFLTERSFFPKGPAKVMLLLSNAIAVENNNVIMVLCSHYGDEELALAALQEGNLFVLNYLLEQGIQLPDDTESLEMALELAAGCDDIELIKKVFAHLPEEQRESFYKQNILPYFFKQEQIKEGRISEQELIARQNIYGDDQALYQMEFDRSVSTISYYMEEGKFTFSFHKEKVYSGFFGPKACGALRARIAHLQQSASHNVFGLLRKDRLETSDSAEKNRYKNYFDMIQPLVDSSGTLDASLEHLAEKYYALNYQIHLLVDGEMVPVTVARTQWTEGELEPIRSWIHTAPEQHCVLADEADRIIQKFLSEIRDSNEKQQIELLKELAFAHQLLAVGTFYYRGSAAISEMVIQACFRYARLEYQQVELIDCFALNSLSRESFVELYPELLRAEDYPALLARKVPAEPSLEEKDQMLREQLDLFSPSVRSTMAP